MKQIVVKVILLGLCSPVFAQGFPPKNYPAHYFRDPLNIPIHLAANFGELRANHYHMGLDIRTEKRVNMPVYAAADGYVARVKIEPEGFGQAIYINHPNGYTTLYAHLNAFFPALARYVKAQQYKNKTWKIFLDIPAGMFPVKKGDFIARSGSTGGSQGPHLHFEIRRTSDDVNLNPMLFGLPVPDDTRPVIRRLALYDMTRSIYEQSPQLFAVERTAAGYGLHDSILFSGAPRIGFAISAFDTQSGSLNPNGIYEAVLYDNGEPLIGFQMDNISYNDTRNINAHIDYKTKAAGGPYLQQLFALPGYTHSIYSDFSGNGSVDISDGAVHAIRIDVKDVYGNTSVLNYHVQYRPAEAVNAAFTGKVFYPFMLDGYETDDCAFYIGENCLYDSVHIAYAKQAAASPGVVSAVHRIGSTGIPLQESFLVRIKAISGLTTAQKDRVLMQRFDGQRSEVRKVEWLDDWASARFDNFGNFQLVVDEEPPVITPVGWKNGANLGKRSAMAFIVKDNFGAYQNFRAELDGNWLCFSNDKEKSFIYRFDEHCKPGKHQLKISVEDIAGNTTTRVFTFIR